MQIVVNKYIGTLLFINMPHLQHSNLHGDILLSNHLPRTNDMVISKFFFFSVSKGAEFNESCQFGKNLILNFSFAKLDDCIIFPFLVQ